MAVLTCSMNRSENGCFIRPLPRGRSAGTGGSAKWFIMEGRLFREVSLRKPAYNNLSIQRPELYWYTERASGLFVEKRRMALLDR
jgi:hypothetical protein